MTYYLLEYCHHILLLFTADYTQEKLSREDYTITDDSVVVNVRHFSLFRIGMKKIGGVKLGFLPLHTLIMPPTRKPILRVVFYHKYKRNEMVRTFISEIHSSSNTSIIVLAFLCFFFSNSCVTV